MLDRLKSLPLTIILTILIWMYAESQVNSEDLVRYTADSVPVWWSGPPTILDHCDVIVRPENVPVTVSGTRDRVDALKLRASQEHGPGVMAYLDITADDRPSDAFTHRALRVVMPPGITVLESPEVTFRLVEKRSSSEPAATRP